MQVFSVVIPLFRSYVLILSICLTFFGPLKTEANTCSKLFNSNSTKPDEYSSVIIENVIKIVPADFIQRTNKRSTTEAEYQKKLDHYLDTPIYRGGGVVNQKLSIDSAIQFLIHPQSLLFGHGIELNRASMLKAFRKYNLRVQKLEVFKRFYDGHLRGRVDPDHYWNSLLTSWSSQISTALMHSWPHFFSYYRYPKSGFGVLIEGLMPKIALNSQQMNTTHKTNFFPGEAEVSIPVAYDPEMIQRLTFWQYEKGTNKHYIQSPDIIQIERIGFNEYILHKGIAPTNTRAVTLDNIEIKRSYFLQIFPNGSHELIEISP